MWGMPLGVDVGVMVDTLCQYPHEPVDALSHPAFMR